MNNVALDRSDYVRKPKKRAPVKVLNSIGKALNNFGFNLGAIDIAKIHELAKKNTGLEDFGQKEYLESLNHLLEAMENEANFHHFGRIAVRTTLVHLLNNRLFTQDFIRKNPYVREQKIERPIFIVGLPRTGTTFLFNLLSQDKKSRWFSNWEGNSPVPISGDNEDRERIGFAQNLYKQFHYFLPDLKKKHEVKPMEPEECSTLFLNTFDAELFWYCYRVPSYRKWLNQRDRLRSYEEYRDQLKILQCSGEGDRWLLKSPTHLFTLKELLEVFPDACIIHTHRDPVEVVPSACSLAATIRGLCSNEVDYAELGHEMVAQWSEGVDKALSYRETCQGNQFFDMSYQEFVADPLGMVQRIYQHFDLVADPKMQEKMEMYIGRNRQHKHGVHRYSLAQFGLTGEEVQNRFSRYMDFLAR